MLCFLVWSRLYTFNYLEQLFLSLCTKQTFEINNLVLSSDLLKRYVLFLFFLLDSLMAVCSGCILAVKSRELSGSESLFKATNSWNTQQSWKHQRHTRKRARVHVPDLWFGQEWVRVFECPLFLKEIYIDLWNIMHLKLLDNKGGGWGGALGLLVITSCTGSQSTGYQTCWMSYKAGWRWNGTSVFLEPSTAGLFLTRP